MHIEIETKKEETKTEDLLKCFFTNIWSVTKSLWGVEAIIRMCSIESVSKNCGRDPANIFKRDSKTLSSCEFRAKFKGTYFVEQNIFYPRTLCNIFGRTSANGCFGMWLTQWLESIVHLLSLCFRIMAMALWSISICVWGVRKKHLMCTKQLLVSKLPFLLNTKKIKKSVYFVGVLTKS